MIDLSRGPSQGRDVALGLRAQRGTKAVPIVFAGGDAEKVARVKALLPEGAKVRRRGRGGADLVMWFVRYRRALERDVVEMAARLGRGAMWIVWPKRGSEVPGDLSQQLVRKAGLAAGLVDYKIGALDRTWSGLKFTRRKK